MSIRIDTKACQTSVAASESKPAGATESFAVVLQNVQKQKSITQEQADYFRSKYLNDRVLRPEEAQSLLGELSQLVEIDKSLTDALASASAEVQSAPAANGWSADQFMKYTDILMSISVDAEETPNLMQALVDSSGYTWTNEWGQMGMLSNGQVVQLGPGVNLNSKGDRQLSGQEIAALREKYMADGSLSAADARFLIGELSSMGAIDGQLAWDLIQGETFSRDFSRSRDAAIPSDNEDWALKMLLDYLKDRRLMFQTKANDEVDLDRWKEHEHWAEQNQKLSDVLSEIASL